MRLSKMCLLNLSRWSVPNFLNQTYYCTRLILLWLKRWMNGGLHSRSESLSKLYLCTEVCLCDCACPACLWMHVYNCVCLPAVAGLWIGSNIHSDTQGQRIKRAHACCLGCTEQKGSDWVWLWSWPQHPFLCSNAVFLLLICLMCPSGLLPWSQVTSHKASNRAECGFEKTVSNSGKWTLDTRCLASLLKHGQ